MKKPGLKLMLMVSVFVLASAVFAHFGTAYSAEDKGKDRKNKKTKPHSVSSPAVAATVETALVPAARDTSEILFSLVERGDTKEIEELLKDDRGEGKMSWLFAALVYAVDCDAPSVIDFAVKKGANPNEQANSGWRPIFNAVYKGKMKALAALIENGADLDSRDADENTPLILVLKTPGNNGEIAKYLIEKGADVNARDAMGFTPLMIAARSGKNAAVKQLIEKGANASSKNKKGATAIDIASKANNTGAVELMKKAAPKEK